MTLSWRMVMWNISYLESESVIYLIRTERVVIMLASARARVTAALLWYAGLIRAISPLCVTDTEDWNIYSWGQSQFSFLQALL